MKRWLLAALLCLIPGCKGKLSHPPEITSEAETGKTELVFWLSDHRVQPDGSQSFSATGLIHGRHVGFDIQFEAWSENGPGYINMSTWESKVVLSSRGAASDELIQFLDQHYSTHLAPRAMAPFVKGKALSPWENPGQFQGDSVNLVLLFHRDFDETNDSEIWLEIRGPEARVRLREKDPRFRRAFVAMLAEHAD